MKDPTEQNPGCNTPGEVQAARPIASGNAVITYPAGFQPVWANGTCVFVRTPKPATILSRAVAAFFRVIERMEGRA